MSQVNVYPSPNFPTQSSSSHSNGSFSPVLIVLAVIFVLVIISVVLGRICNRRYSKGDSHSKVGSSRKKGKSSKHEDKFHHRHHHQTGDGDIEFGFDKRFASSKVASNNGDHPHFNFKPPNMMARGGAGEPKGPSVRFADDHIEFRPGA